MCIRDSFDIWGIDRNREHKAWIDTQLAIWNPAYDKNKFKIADLAAIPFPAKHFDFIISSAVLHFAQSRPHFIQLFEETIRVLKVGGIFWFRMTTKHTLEEKAQRLQEDIYALPDGSTRYLLDIAVLSALMEKHHLNWLDPMKTVNVADLRTMSVIVLQKIA